MLVVDPSKISNKKVIVLTEDNEARWFLRELLSESIKRQILMPEMERGCEAMASFNHQTYPALKKSLIVLDGDFKASYKEFNLLTLPGGNSPEGVIYDFLKSLPPDHFLLNNQFGITKRTLNEFGPFSKKYSKMGKNRLKYKHWFRDNDRSLYSLNVLSYWKEVHKNDIDIFIKNFQYKITCISQSK